MGVVEGRRRGRRWRYRLKQEVGVGVEVEADFEERVRGVDRGEGGRDDD